MLASVPESFGMNGFSFFVLLTTRVPHGKRLRLSQGWVLVVIDSECCHKWQQSKSQISFLYHIQAGLSAFPQTLFLLFTKRPCLFHCEENFFHGIQDQMFIIRKEGRSLQPLKNSPIHPTCSAYSFSAFKTLPAGTAHKTYSNVNIPVVQHLDERRIDLPMVWHWIESTCLIPDLLCLAFGNFEDGT